MALQFKKKAINRLYPAETITDADYVDDIALQANTPTQAKSLLHSCGAGNRRHWSPYECRQNRVHVF